MNLVYDCETKEIVISELGITEPKRVQLTISENCREESVYSYSNPTVCKKFGARVAFNTISEEGSPNDCTLVAEWGWQIIPNQTLSSITGTITKYFYDNVIGWTTQISNITSLSQINGTAIMDSSIAGITTIDIDVTMTSIYGCKIRVVFHIDDSCAQCLCDKDIPSTATSTTTHLSNNGFTINDDGDIVLSDIGYLSTDGVYGINVNILGTEDEANEVYCLFVDCGNIKCQLSNFLQEKLTCDNCSPGEPDLSVYLKYMLFLDSLECGDCCQSSTLYNSIKNEIGECSTCS